MKLEWMGKYRELVEAHIKSANRYAQNYHIRSFSFEDVFLSAAQIQVMEYILEGEHSCMCELAKRLGITRSALTKHVRTLEKSGLVVKEHPEKNEKAYTLTVTEKGKRAYADYAGKIYKSLFSKIFTALDGMDEENLNKVLTAYRIINGE